METVGFSRVYNSISSRNMKDVETEHITHVAVSGLVYSSTEYNTFRTASVHQFNPKRQVYESIPSSYTLPVVS